MSLIKVRNRQRISEKEILQRRGCHHKDLMGHQHKSQMRRNQHLTRSGFDFAREHVEKSRLPRASWTSEGH
eukprot:Skav220614  [mRNA]  locus=scaffold507:311114:312048:- [translate_table: standard]